MASLFFGGLGGVTPPAYYIPHTGQSLGCGDYGDPPVSTVRVGANFALADSADTWDITAPNAPTLSVGPLVAPERAPIYTGGGIVAEYPSNIGGETAVVAAADLALATGRRAGGGTSAQGGAGYSVICKGGTGNAYAANMYEVQSLMRLVPGAGSSYLP